MSPAAAEALARLPELTSAHLQLTLAALAIGMAISLPLGVAAAANPAARRIAVASASVIQTIPGLALLALMVPLFGGRIGFAPALAALSLYAVLPVLRNTIVGLAGVDPAVREAAQGLGMTWSQRMLRVELPLAAPVIMAGLRTATVWVAGAATLATPVGASSLGDLIFAGLQTRAWDVVVIGCVAAAALAVLLDQVMGFAERAAADGDRRSGAAAVAGAGVAAALLALPAMTGAPAGPGAGAPGAAAAQATSVLAERPIRIGAKTFTEQFILARVIAARIEAAGGTVELVEGLGSAVVFDALANDEIDVYVDYSGTLYANVLRRTDAAPRDLTLARVSADLLDVHGVLALGALGFENAYAFAMRADAAANLNARAVGDLAAHADALTVGSDYEFFGRPEWARTRDAYGLGAINTRSMDSGFMYDAVRTGAVDVITAFTTDGRIDRFDLALLADPVGALPPYDAMLLLAPGMASDRGVADALRPLIQAVAPEAMRRANAMVDLEGASPAQAATALDREIRGEGASP